MAEPSIDQSQLPVEPLKPKPDRSEYNRQRYAKNKERIREVQRRYQSTEQAKAKARERARRYYDTEYARQYYVENKQRLKQVHAEYRSKNRESIRKRGKLYSSEYRSKNPERIKELFKEWYSKNRENLKERKKQYRSKNRERIREYSAKTRERRNEFRRSNPERWKIYQKRYRATHKVELLIKTRREQARKKSRTVIEDEPAIAAFYKFVKTVDRIKCHWCKQLVEKENRTIDHIIPLIKGGLHSAINLCCACQHCNATKQARLPEEIAGQGFLAFG